MITSGYDTVRIWLMLVAIGFRSSIGVHLRTRALGKALPKKQQLHRLASEFLVLADATYQRRSWRIHFGKSSLR